MHDQAHKLRQRMQHAVNSPPPPPTKSVGQAHTIAVTSGKGGVGKTNFTINFALQLAKSGYRVVLFDADLGLANIDVMLGITPRFTLFDLLRPELTVYDVMERGPYDVRVIPGSSGFQQLFTLTPTQGEQIIAQLRELQNFADFIIVDTGAGLSEQVLPLILTADDVVLVTTPEPTAITDGYAVMKYLFKRRSDLSLWVLINRAVNSKEAHQTGNKIKSAAREFLRQEIQLLGSLPENPDVVRSVKRQQPFTERYPHSPVSRRLQQVIRHYLSIREQATVQPEGSGFMRFLQHIIRRKT